MNTDKDTATPTDDPIDLLLKLCFDAANQIHQDVERLDAQGGGTLEDCQRVVRDIDRLKPFMEAVRRVLMARLDPPATPADLDPPATPRLH
jgi:hypothetical protein